MERSGRQPIYRSPAARGGPVKYKHPRRQYQVPPGPAPGMEPYQSLWRARNHIGFPAPARTDGTPRFFFFPRACDVGARTRFPRPRGDRTHPNEGKPCRDTNQRSRQRGNGPAPASGPASIARSWFPPALPREWTLKGPAFHRSAVPWVPAGDGDWTLGKLWRFYTSIWFPAPEGIETPPQALGRRPSRQF